MIAGRPAPAASERQRHGRGQIRAVVGEVFDVLGIPLLKGRGFTAQDSREAPAVIVIDQTMADEYWPDEDPIGKQLTLVDSSTGEPLRDRVRTERPREIVGVVGATRQWGVQFEPRPVMYVPEVQSLSPPQE